MQDPLEAWASQKSRRKIHRESSVVFYVPDVLSIPDSNRAFTNVNLSVGDGASLRRPIQRQHDGTRWVTPRSRLRSSGAPPPASVARSSRTAARVPSSMSVRPSSPSSLSAKALGIDALVAIDDLKVSLR